MPGFIIFDSKRIGYSCDILKMYSSQICMQYYLHISWHQKTNIACCEYYYRHKIITKLVPHASDSLMSERLSLHAPNAGKKIIFQGCAFPRKFPHLIKIGFLIIGNSQCHSHDLKEEISLKVLFFLSSFLLCAHVAHRKK